MVHRRRVKSWLVCQCEEDDLNTVYAIAVKTDSMKVVQIKCNNDLSRFQLHFIMNFFLAESKLAHDPVIFPACSICHFVMNIIIWLTGSTTKVNSTNCHIFSNAAKYLSAKIYSHTV